MMQERLDWHESKRRANFLKHGVDFHEVAAFDWDNALVKIDTRRDYGELRWIALGSIRRRLHVMVYSRRSDAIRLISLRKADRREFLYYVSQIDPAD